MLSLSLSLDLLVYHTFYPIHIPSIILCLFENLRKKTIVKNKEKLPREHLFVCLCESNLETFVYYQIMRHVGRVDSLKVIRIITPCTTNLI